MKKNIWCLLVGMLAIAFTACEPISIGVTPSTGSTGNSQESIAGRYYSYKDNIEAELNLLSNHSFSYSVDQYIPRTGNELETHGSGTWSYRDGKIYCEGYYYRINHNSPSSNWSKNDIYEFEYHNSYVQRGSVTMTKK